MDIQCDRFIGWMIDISIELFNQVKDEYNKKYSDLTSLSTSKIWSKDRLAATLLDNGFIGSDYLVDYNSEERNQIILLINEKDKYIKLICVEELIDNYEDLFVGSHENDVTLNKFLKQVPVPEDIENRMLVVYQELFKFGVQPSISIELQVFQHWYNRSYK